MREVNKRVRRYVEGGLSRVSRRTWLQLGALLIALLAAWPLLSGEGLLNTRGGGDSPFLLQRLHQMASALEDGHFPVRWMPDANYGYGYPFFNFYAPLSIYVAALFRLVGFSYVHSLQLAQLSGFLVAAWATFRLAERWFGDGPAALLAAAAYTVAPFHMVNVYVRGDSLAEFWAMALFPLVLLAADRATTPGKEHAGSLGLALSYAALVLSHNISALIFTPFLLLYLALALSGYRAETLKSLLAATLSGLLLGLALSSWFWVPALAETSLAQTGPITQGYFHYSGHFLGAELVQPEWLFDYDVADRNAFRMGLVQALLAGAGLAFLLWRGRRGGRRLMVPSLFILGTAAIATLMITPLSRPLWDGLPLLPYTQFPWRFLSVQALAGALATGALALIPGDRFRTGLLLGLLMLLLGAGLGDLAPSYMAITDADVTAPRLAEYEWFTGNIGSTVSAEYLPPTVLPRPFTSSWLETGSRNETRVVAGKATTRLLSREAMEQRWQVQAGNQGATVIFPTLYWPGWRALLDGQAAPASASTSSGLIQVDVPAGAHSLTLSLGRTPVRLLGEVLSLLALLLFLLLAARRLPWRRIRWRRYLAWPGLLLLLLVAVQLWPEDTLSPETLSWDFAQMGYLHHAPDGIRFSNGARLAEYGYSRESAAPGEDLAITLQWTEGAEPEAVQGADEQQEAPIQVTVALATPAVHRYQTAPVLMAETLPLTGPKQVYRFSLPPDTPAGLYVPRLTVSEGQPLLPTGETRGDLFLRPLRVISQDGEASTGPTLQVRADEIEVQGTMPSKGSESVPTACNETPAGTLLVELSWYTPRPLAANYVASLRLLDDAGRVLAQCDLQPGYGFRPSSGWPAGEWVRDRLALPLPGQLEGESSFPLVLNLYLPGVGGNILTRRLGELAWQGDRLRFNPTEPSFTLPERLTPAEVRFGDAIALRGYRLAQDPASLSLTLFWEALAAGKEGYVRFVQLLDPETGQIVERADGSPVQQDGIPQQGSYPTGQWTTGEIIADPLTLSLQGVPPGDYRLALGFYPATSPGARLPALDDEGQSLPQNAFLLPPITVSN